MATTDVFRMLMPHIVFSIPFLIIWSIGLVFAIKNRRKHNPVSAVAGTAFILFIVTNVADIVFQGWLHWLMVNSSHESRVNSIANQVISRSIWSAVSIGLSTIAAVLIVIAIFGWRGEISDKRENSLANDN